MRIHTKGMICSSAALKSPRRLHGPLWTVFEKLHRRQQTMRRAPAALLDDEKEHQMKGRHTAPGRHSRVPGYYNTFGLANTYVKQQGLTSHETSQGYRRPRCPAGLSPHLT